MSNATLREALEQAHDLSLDDRHKEAREVIRAALAADDAARGAMLEQFEAWASANGYNGIDDMLAPMDRAMKALLWSAWQAAQKPLPTFDEVWGKKEAEGYQYGHDALTQVKFGYRLACEALQASRAATPQSVEPLKGWKLNHVQFKRGEGKAEIGYLDPEDDRFSPVVTVDTGLYYQPEHAVPLAAAILEAVKSAAPPVAPTDAEWQEEAMRLIDCYATAKLFGKIELEQEKRAALRAHIATRPQGDGWIACSERMPEACAQILMVAVGAGPRVDYTTDRYAGWLDDLGTWVRWPHPFPPTHWRPLPAPPTKKE